MIEGLKPYAEYKESGSKWLGEMITAVKVELMASAVRNESGLVGFTVQNCGPNESPRS